MDFLMTNNRQKTYDLDTLETVSHFVDYYDIKLKYKLMTETNIILYYILILKSWQAADRSTIQNGLNIFSCLIYTVWYICY